MRLLLSDLGKEYDVVFAVFFCALRAGGVGDEYSCCIKLLLRKLFFDRRIPLGRITIGSLKYKCFESSREGYILLPRYRIGDWNHEVTVPCRRLIREPRTGRIEGVCCGGCGGELGAYRAKVERHVEDASYATYDKRLRVPGNFLIVPGGGVELLAAGGVVHRTILRRCEITGKVWYTGGMTITWNESLAIDIAEIDDQHHRFVDLIGKLETAIAEGTEATHLGDVFGELEQYVKYHFANEERHFAEFGCYPDAERHIAVHRAFEKHMRELKFQFLDDQRAQSVELARALYDWLQHHIAGMDREYVECFKSKGL